MFLLWIFSSVSIGYIYSRRQTDTLFERKIIIHGGGFFWVSMSKSRSMNVRGDKLFIVCVWRKDGWMDDDDNIDEETAQSIGMGMSKDNKSSRIEQRREREERERERERETLREPWCR